MLKSFLFSSVALVAIGTPFAVQAQTGGDTVIVSATRIPTPQIQVASSVTVIDGAQIEARQQRTLPDALRSVPGLSLVQAGGPGGQTSLFLRGTNASHTKVLVDGIDIADPSTPSGAADISKYLTGDIARIEVLRGPQSGLYGSDAIGGVISITTAAGQGPLTLSGRAEGGSFETLNQTLALRGSDEGVHYAATLDHVHAGSTPVTPLNLLPPGGKRNNDYYDSVAASLRLGADLSSSFDLGLVARYSDALSRITGDAFSLATFTSVPAATQTRINTKHYETRGTAHWNAGWIDQTFGVAYNSTSQSNLDPNNGSLPNSGDRLKFDWQGNVALGEDHTLVLGAESARDEIHIPLAAAISNNALFGELQSRLGENLFTSASVRYDDNGRFGGHTTWRVAPAIVVENTKLKASVGSGFKAPSLEQLFQSFPAFGFFANPNLKPETSIGYEAGFEQGLGAVSGGATWFHNDIRNLIANNATFTSNINVGKATTQGAEVFVAFRANEDLSLRADYTYTDATDGVAHLQLLRRPRHKTSVTADWQAMPALDLNATLLFVGPQIDGNRDFSVPRMKVAGYTTANFAANWKINGNFSLFGRVENAFDESYESPVGFLRPGVGAYAGIKANF